MKDTANDYRMLAKRLRETARMMKEDGVETDIIADVLESARSCDRAAWVLCSYENRAVA